MPNILREMSYDRYHWDTEAQRYANSGIIFSAPVEFSDEESIEVLTYLTQMFPEKLFYRYETLSKEIKWRG